MEWETLLNAVQAWAVDQLAGFTVRWANQNLPLPAYPFVILNVTGEKQLGRDQIRYELNEDTGRLDPLVCGNREFTVSIQIFTKSAPVTTHSTHARAKASRLRASLQQDFVLAAFHTAGVAVVRCEATQNLDRVIDGEWIAITSMDLLLAAAMNLSDSSTYYIETADGTGTFPPSDFTVTGPWGVGA